MAPSNSLTPGRRIDVAVVFFAAQILVGFIPIIFGIMIGNSSLRASLRDDLPEYLILAISFSQVTLLATWNALREGSRSLRTMGTLAGLFLIWLISFGATTWLGYTGIGFVIPGMAMLVQWTVVQVPLWTARLIFGWRMGVVDACTEAADASKVQFGIRHLILWTTLIAIVLGLSKSLLREQRLDHDALAYGMFLICNSLVAWPIVLASLTNRWMPLALVAAFGLVSAVTIAEPYVFRAVLGDNSELRYMFFWLNGIQFVWLAGSMLVLRRIGFRIVKAGQLQKAT